MHMEYLFTSLAIWTVHQNMPVKATRPQECRIEYLRSVCGGQKDNSLARIKAVHFH